MHKLTANTDGLTEVAASQQGSTDLEIRAEQIATAAMGEFQAPSRLSTKVVCFPLMLCKVYKNNMGIPLIILFYNKRTFSVFSSLGAA